jgi:DNA-binding XRE family transcriptional regulator
MKSSAKPEPEARAEEATGATKSSSKPAEGDVDQDKQRANEQGGEPSANEPSTSSSEPVPARPVVAKKTKRKVRARSRAGLEPNNVRKLRQEAMMSKAELARRAGVSPLTIDRVEAGCPCRMDTKRKILEALGLKPSARAEVWPDIDAQS